MQINNSSQRYFFRRLPSDLDAGPEVRAFKTEMLEQFEQMKALDQGPDDLDERVGSVRHNLKDADGEECFGFKAESDGRIALAFYERTTYGADDGAVATVRMDYSHRSGEDHPVWKKTSKSKGTKETTCYNNSNGTLTHDVETYAYHNLWR